MTPHVYFCTAAKLPTLSLRTIAAISSICCCAEFRHIYTSIKESASLKVHWNEELKADSQRYILIAGPAVQLLRCLPVFTYHEVYTDKYLVAGPCEASCLLVCGSKKSAWHLYAQGKTWHHAYGAACSKQMALLQCIHTRNVSQVFGHAEIGDRVCS